MLFRDPVQIIQACRPDEVQQAFLDLEAKLSQGWYLAGYIAYEAGLVLEPSLSHLVAPAGNSEPLLWFGCYREPLASEDAFPLPAVDVQDAQTSLRFSNSKERYEQQVEAVRACIAAGETYQLNLTMAAEWDLAETPSGLYERLLRAQPVPYAALLHPWADRHIVSVSPELFFRKEGDHIVTRPMKGTAPPGMDVAERQEHAEWLVGSEKDRAENLMIVDLLRNDLNRVCRTGSVEVSKLFQVEVYPTVLQMTSTVEGDLREGVGLLEIFRALFPSGSIVGAPKIHSMRLLAGLENRARGVYTGAIGFMHRDEAEFSVAIRTVSVEARRATCGVGSGITYDSNPALEFEECMTKTSFLTRRPDPAFQLLETLLFRDGRYVSLQEHLARMARSAEFFDYPFDKPHIRGVLTAAALHWTGEDRLRVRLLLDRTGRCTCSASAAPAAASHAISLLLQEEQTSAADKFLRHKTTHRPLYNRAFQQAEAAGFADGLFQNSRGEVTEAAIHNILALVEGQWITPPVSSGVLPGIYRQQLLDQGLVQERVLSFTDLLGAEQIRICNSVRGLRTVSTIVRPSTGGRNETVWASRPARHSMVDG